MFSEKSSCECMGFSVFMRKIPKTALAFLPCDTVRRFVLKVKKHVFARQGICLDALIKYRKFNLSISSYLKYKFCWFKYHIVWSVLLQYGEIRKLLKNKEDQNKWQQQQNPNKCLQPLQVETQKLSTFLPSWTHHSFSWNYPTGKCHIAHNWLSYPNTSLAPKTP